MQNFDSSRLRQQLPGFFSDLLKDLLSQGYTPTLVGGAVRDFLLHDQLGTDWDIELTHKTLSFGLQEWKALGKRLGQYGRTTFLPYDVIRLEVKQHNLEFSPPRIEHFDEHLKDQGHKNFSVVFDYQLPFEQAVKRRDFSVNAIGVRFHSLKELELMDPLEGVRHLRDSLLYPAGPDFPKDPVRFLRALRFKRKLNFEFSPELEAMLKSMRTDGFSSTYLWNEMQKSEDPLNFYRELLQWKEHHPELRLPLGEEILPRLDELRKVLKDAGHHEAWMIALEWVGISSTSWQSFFGQSSDSARRLGRWASESRAFQKILPETFHGEFEVIRELPQFETLFDWYFTTRQLLQKNPRLPLLQMIEDYLPEWIHLFRFEVVKDVKHIDPPFRAKYQVWNLCQRL